MATGLILFALQFGLLFLAIGAGMPAGLAAVGLQAQAPLSLGLAALLHHERPAIRDLLGTAVACAGLVLLASSLGWTDGVTETNIPILGIVLILGAALSWAIGNLLIQRIEAPSPAGLIAWLSLVPPLPLL